LAFKAYLSKDAPETPAQLILARRCLCLQQRRLPKPRWRKRLPRKRSNVLSLHLPHFQF